MPKLDLELIMSKLETYIKANLNTQVQAINTEKADSLTLIDIPNDSYFFQTWNDKILQKPVAIFYGLQESKATGNGPATIQDLKIFVDFIIIDNGQDSNAVKKIMRYTRALKEIVESGWDRIAGSQKFQVNVMVPVAFKAELDSSEDIKLGGIMISTSIA